MGLCKQNKTKRQHFFVRWNLRPIDEFVSVKRSIKTGTKNYYFLDKKQ